MSDHEHGQMDISQHEGTYAGFMVLTKYGTAACVVLLALMAFFLV